MIARSKVFAFRAFPDLSIPPMPIRALGLVEAELYLIRDYIGATNRLSLVDLCDAEILISLCGDGGEWLRHYFPAHRIAFGTGAVAFGIDTTCAAHFLADTCIEQANKALLASLATPPKQSWSARFRAWSARWSAHLPAGAA